MNSRCIGRTNAKYCSRTDGRGSSPLFDVATKAPGEANVGVGVDIDLEVEVIAKISIGQNQDAFNDDHRCRLDPIGLVRPEVRREVIGRPIDRGAL